MNNTVIVSVALLGSLLGGARLGRVGLGGSGLLLLGLLLLNLTGASLAGSSNVVGPDVDGKVLQGIAVDDTLGRVGLGEGKSISVVLGEMINSLLADGGDVENSMEEISGPEGVQLGVGDGVTQVADTVKVAADRERERADDGLSGGIVTSPVASPSCNN